MVRESGCGAKSACRCAANVIPDCVTYTTKYSTYSEIVLDDTVAGVSRAPLDTEQVVDAAAALADEEGLDAVTLTWVARNLGVQQPALYRHVDGIDDLMRLLGLRGREFLAEQLTDCAVGVAGDDAVHALGVAWRKAAASRPGLYAATDRFPCAGDAELELAVERVVEIIARSLDSYPMSDDERIHAARSLRSAFHGFVHLEAGDGHPLPLDLDDSFQHLIEFLCAGLHALSAPPPP